MIKKETVKRTRDFLNFVKSNVHLVGGDTGCGVSAISEAWEVSRGRMKAAVDLGMFVKTGKNSFRNTYKCVVPYFNMEMAEAVIRHEYNARDCVGYSGKPKEQPKAPSAAVRQPLRPDDLKWSSYGNPFRKEPKVVVPITTVVDVLRKDVLSVVLPWFRKNGYRGVIYRDKEIVEL